ncbi:hypothetical protein AU252_15825 [Pseudarthrobacter sulfonivorans]|uniref:Response regulatory domain-containing protein n=1 Tax=Pseudarthrobacter sulfonivorans TaxID=121292 RepID=A0A0U2XEX6_9MICC|nr:hypothetical protein AU252_15825 [Pseudarthrobacter sulfonivorans]
MVTVRTDEPDRLTGLDIGADDYISKPFSPRELQSRINALFRRAGTATTDYGARDELARASEVQRSLLPRAPVLRADFEAAGRFQPSGSVGGDFYDWYSTPEGLHVYTEPIERHT